MTPKIKVLILGGGYAGVTAATGLRAACRRHGRLSITLVNKHNYHYFTTLLHQCVGRRGYQDISVDLPSLLQPEINFRQGQAVALTPNENQVEIESEGTRHTLDYDYLVLALGWEPQFYNISGLEQHALVLKNLNMARIIKNRIEEQMALASEHPAETWRTQIIVGGGGFTGAEVAGELADWCPRLIDRYDLKSIGITLIEGAPAILPGFDGLLVKDATCLLQQKQINLITGARIERVEERCVALADGRRLEAGVIIWTGGVRGHPLVEASGFTVNKQGRAEVNSYLQSVDSPNVYVIGDCCLAKDADGKALPPTAQIAFQQGKSVAQNLQRVLAGKAPVPFMPKVLGTFLTLGRKDALGVMQNKYRFSGWTAKMMKHFIAYRYLWGIGGLGLPLRKFWERR